TGLPEFMDDTVTDYSKPSPTVVSTSAEGQNKDSSTTEDVASPNPPKPFVKIRVQREKTRSQNHTYKSPSRRSGGHRPHGTPMRPSYRPAGHRPHGPSMNPRRPNMNGARLTRSFFQAPSYETRLFYKSSVVKTPYRAPWVPTVNRNNTPVNRKFSNGRRNFPTANRKFPTASRKFATGSTNFHTVDMGRKRKAVKPSASWTWNPLHKLSNKGLINNNVLVMFKKYTYIDTQGRLKSDSGCSRHMTYNISYLFDFEPFDGGYVSFGQGGCKITGKGTIKIDSECIVLGRNFKLLDDANIFLRTPRQNNMYSIDLNNIVPHRDLTCLVAKASTDKCMLWHRRLGHLNFKTMNKLVRHNLVRGLPTKCFENDHTCTACMKGKQHKAS
nr:ribonuclease H-like domain-containing protein [Tanacetum cinerariifolium]